MRVLLHTPDAVPLISVRDTLRVLEALGEGECIEALEFVYFDNVKLPMKKNEITYRVRRFATERYIDERTVYRRLERAGRIWRSIMDKRMSERAA